MTHLILLSQRHQKAKNIRQLFSNTIIFLYLGNVTAESETHGAKINRRIIFPKSHVGTYLIDKNQLDKGSKKNL